MSAPKLSFPYGSGGGAAGVSGSGTAGKVPVWTGATALGDSPLTVNGLGVEAAGPVTAVGASAGAPAYRGPLGGDTGFYFPAGGAIGVASNGVLSAYMAPGGAWGFGTTTPDAFGRVVLQVGTTTLGLNCDATRAEIQSFNKPLAINRQGNNTLLNEGGGNVGIGTATPQEKVQVYGDLKVGVLANGAFISLADEGGTSKNVGIYRAVGATALSLGGYGGVTIHAGAAALGSQTERVRITQLGNVGIGTTSPASRLHVEGSNNEVVGTFRRTNTGASAGPALVLDGIGNSSNYAGILFQTDGTNIAKIVQEATGSVYFDYNMLGAYGSLYFRAAGLSAVSVRYDGNVGIGTTSPASRLDVAGTITCDDAGTGLKLPVTPGSGDAQTLDCYQEVAQAAASVSLVDLSAFKDSISNTVYPQDGASQLATLTATCTVGYTRVGRMVHVRGVYTATAVTYSGVGTHLVPAIDASSLPLPAAQGFSVCIPATGLYTTLADTTGVFVHALEYRPTMVPTAGGVQGRILIGVLQSAAGTLARNFAWGSGGGAVVFNLNAPIHFSFSYEAA